MSARRRDDDRILDPASRHPMEHPVERAVPARVRSKDGRGTPMSARASKRAKLSLEDVVAAALEMVDSTGGIDNLTVRSLATRLNVGAMTLYGYFNSKDDLLDAVADHVMATVRMPEKTDETPGEAIRTVAAGFIDLMSEHPSVVELLATRTTRSPQALQAAMERVLERLVAAGIPGPIAVQCYAFLIQHAIGFATYRTPRPWGGDSTPEDIELRRQQQHFYSALPATDFPLVVEWAAELVKMPAREMYDFAVEALVRRVEQLILVS